MVDIGGRTEWETNRLGYWLTKIQILADKEIRSEEETNNYSENSKREIPESEKTPVIIVCNKCDSKHAIKPRIDLNVLNEKYEHLKIVGFFPLSCEKGTNISNIKEEIKNQLESFEVFKEIPRKYINVKRKIEILPENFITKAHFDTLATDDQNQIQNILDRIGTITTFLGNPRLRDLIVVKPKWITEGIYKILSANHILEPEKGKADIDKIKAILNDRECPNKDDIIEIMKDF